MSAIARAFKNFFEWLKGLFWKTEMEITLVGLQNAGKTTLVNVLATGKYSEDMIPTVGFNMRKVSKGNVTIKLWDLGGQPRFRNMWERYCRGVNSIIYVIDSADHEKFETARSELHELVARPPLAGIPLLVLGNKNDLQGAAGVDELTEKLALSDIRGREVSVYSISAKNNNNVDVAMKWLIQRGKSKSRT